nr:hypothetical protein [Fodinicola feengrottensis]
MGPGDLVADQPAKPRDVVIEMGELGLHVVVANDRVDVGGASFDAVGIIHGDFLVNRGNPVPTIGRLRACVIDGHESVVEHVHPLSGLSGVQRALESQPEKVKADENDQ